LLKNLDRMIRHPGVEDASGAEEADRRSA